MTEHERRRDALLIALPLAVLAVLIALAVAGGVYLELSEQTAANRKLAHETAALARELKTVQQGREDALVAVNQAQLDTCYSRNANGPALRRLLEAVKPALQSEAALATVDSYIELTREVTPTRAECNELADTLGLPRQT